MAKEMNKTFEYGSYKFNIKVELHIKRIVISDMGAGNWRLEKEVATDEEVLGAIEGCKNSAISYVNNRDNRPEIEKQLSDLGFK